MVFGSSLGLLSAMIETPINKEFLYLLLWVWVIRSNPNLILLGLTVDSCQL